MPRKGAASGLGARAVLRLEINKADKLEFDREVYVIMSLSLALLIMLMVVSYIFALLGFLGTGIIIDDNYVFASKEKRRHMDKKAYYLQSAIIFLCLGTMFLQYIIRLLTGIVYFKYTAFMVCFAAMIYAIVSHYTIKKKQ